MGRKRSRQEVFVSRLWATGSGQIQWWIFHDDDEYVAVDFDNDGADELLAINEGTGWAQLMKYDALSNSWSMIWSNGGSGQLVWWIQNPGDRFVGGDFDGVPGDELLAYSPLTEWVQILRFSGGEFHFVWGNGGHGRLHAPSTLLSGDFAGSDRSQLMSLADRHWAYLESFRMPSEVFSVDP